MFWSTWYNRKWKYEKINNNGIIVDIEMKVRQITYFENRTLHYGAKLLSQETKRGTEHKNVKQLILINMNMDIAKIEEATGDSKEEINSIKKRINN